MKKTLTFVMSLVMGTLCSAIIAAPFVGAPVSASAQGFVFSPSDDYTPEIKDYINADEKCTATLTATGYAQRDRLDEAKKQELEYAYATLTATSDITTLNADFATLVTEKGLTGATVAVSDFFDVSCYNCDDHDAHGEFIVEMECENAATFVGLLHYTSGAWELIKSPAVNVEEKTVTFTVEDFSPFAIVVDTSGLVDAPIEPVDTMPTLVTTAVTSFAVLAMLVVVLKK